MMATARSEHKQIEYESAATLMAHGPHALHEHVASKLKPALGRALPQLEVRFCDLSLSVDIVELEEERGSKSELPTIARSVKTSLAKLLSTKHVRCKEILKSVSGVFKPGTLTLVLGQPGSGKSALMKVLSGGFPMNKNVTIEGDISYNGVAQHEIKRRLPQLVTYVDQRDKHFPTLSVKETLEFAHTFCGGELARRGDELLSQGTAEQNQAALTAAKAMHKHSPGIVIQQLGLQSCQDTILGNGMLRGVSGGERKRVTTGEMEFGSKYVTFMDEISTGLDSAATFDIVCTQRSIAETFGKTIVIALLQPSPEVFSLFDDVLLLNDGEVMYHGPRKQVVDYFASLGFVCPPHRDVADYLLDLGTKQQHKYTIDTSSVLAQQPPRSASEFAECFRRSAIHAEMLRALDVPLHSSLLATVNEHMAHTPEFHLSFWDDTATLLRRQLLVQSRATTFLVGRALMVVIVALVNASTFYQLEPTQVQVVMGITYGSILFLSLGQSTQVPTFFEARDVFYKQRKANFFRTSAYVLANSLAQVPMAIAETIVFGALVYWMCGFVARIGEFLLFELVLFLASMVFGTWFFFLAAVCPDINIAAPLSLLSVATPILFSGFIVLKSKIPDYFIWIYWMTPLSWSIRALAVNQYRSNDLDVCEYGGVNYCAQHGGKTMGEFYLDRFDVASERYWIPSGVAVLIFQYGLTMVMSYLALEYKRYESPENIAVSEKGEVTTCGTTYALTETPKSAEFDSGFSASGSGKVVLEIRSTGAAFTPVTLAFKDLWYTVPLPGNPRREAIDLLKGITGYALPGTMTALMGSSGAGKTTLMDVIAGRKTGGKIRGKILLNGYTATDLAIRRSTGYCEQADIHSESSTIREALTFSAFLRQDASVPASKKLASVNECLDLLDMHTIADQIIRGSSVEQMKRLTIGVELAAQPSVLFLDEPTSGLDARSAKLVMDGVRKVANTGRTVVCTIHQPSSEVFFLFDSVLLLKRGGETVFFGDLGDGCRNLIDYFEAIPGVAPLPTGMNPATWMLECIGAGVGNASVNTTDFVQAFSASERKQALDAAMAKPGVCSPVASADELTFTQKRAASSGVQMAFVLGRFMDLYWRASVYNLTRFIMSIVLALLFGLVFAGADYASYEGVSSAVGMLFLLLVFKGFVAFSSVIPIAIQDRASYYRERASQTYNTFWYFLGSSVVEIPYVFFAALVFTMIFFPTVGFTGVGTAVLFWLDFALTLLMQTYMGQFFAFALPTEEVAGILGVLVTNILILFMGYSPPASAIPANYHWLYEIAPQRFSLSIAVALVFSECSTNPMYDVVAETWSNVGPELGCQPLANPPLNIGPTTVKRFAEQFFGIKRDDIASHFCALLGYIVFFRVLTVLSMRYVSHQKR